MSVIRANCDMIYEAPYSDPTTSEKVKPMKTRRVGTITVPQSYAAYEEYAYVVVGSYHGSRATTCDVCAFGPGDEVFQPTSSSETHSSNGVYWYNRIDTSMGFAGSSVISLSPYADLSDSECAYRLSWPLSNSGYRSGCTKSLDSSSEYFKFVGYCSPGLHPEYYVANSSAIHGVKGKVMIRTDRLSAVKQLLG